MMTRNSLRKNGFSIFCFCLIAVIWFLPAVTVLIQIIRPASYGETEAFPPSTGLLSTPPPWADQSPFASRWLELTLRSLRLSLTTICLALPPSLGLAVVIYRSQFLLTGSLRFLYQALIFLPLPVVATSWLGAIGNLGRSQAFGLGSQPLLSGWIAASFVHALASVPLLSWIFGSVLLRTDSDLEAMARNEHPPLRAFLKSSLTQIRPAIWASALVVMILTAGDMTVTDLVQERTFAEESYLQAQMGDGLSAASRTALPPVLSVGLLMVFWFRRNRLWLDELGRANISQTRHRDWLDGSKAKLLGILALVLTLMVWGIPFLALVWRAGRSGGVAQLELAPKWSVAALFHNLREALPDLVETMPQTLFTALTVGIICTVTAWLLCESASENRFITRLLLVGSALGIATPGPVAGLALVWVWMPVRWVYDSSLIVILAQIYRLLPVAVLLVWPSILFRQTALNDLARLDGLGHAIRFQRVVWPAMGPLVVSTVFIVSALSLGELPASNLVAPPGFDLFSVRLWALMHTGLESHLSAVVLVAVGFFGLLVLLAFGLSKWVMRTRP
ncbi:MAG: Inner rane transporter permease protein YcjP [Planctomycetota bacterium]